MFVTLAYAFATFVIFIVFDVNFRSPDICSRPRGAFFMEISNPSSKMTKKLEPESKLTKKRKSFV